jgi:hypothetical protein
MTGPKEVKKYYEIKTTKIEMFCEAADLKRIAGLLKVSAADLAS